MNIIPISSAEAYRLEEYTDDKAGAIIRMIPVTANGEQDPFRQERFTGKTFMQTNHGPIEIRFNIEALDLTDAFAKWNDALKVQLAEMESAAVKQRIVNGAQLTSSQARALAIKKN